MPPLLYLTYKLEVAMEYKCTCCPAWICQRVQTEEKAKEKMVR